MSTEKKTTRREALGILMLGAVGVTVVGCGGGGNSDSEGRKTSVRLRVSWPATPPVTRYLPTYAVSLYFELYPKLYPEKRTTLVVNRPANLPAEQDISFAGLYVEGDYVLAGAARVQPDGQGASVATGVTEVAVRPGMAPVALTLGTTLKRLEIVGQPLQATVGVKQTLISGAFDPDNRSLLLPGGALTWSVVSGGEFGSITTAGELTPTAAGTLKVRVAEPGAGVSTEADVTVTAQQVNVTLANTAWPKDGADVANTGRGGGQGSTGVQKWVYEFGDPGGATTFGILSGPIVGDGLVYATDYSGNTVALRVADGSVAWRVKSDFRSTMATPLLLSDNTLVTGGTLGGLFGLDGLTGLEKWRNADPSVQGLSFSAARKIIVSERNSIGFYEPTTGRSASGVSVGNTASMVAVGPTGTLFYVTNSGFTQVLRASDPVTGTVLWTQTLSQYSTSSIPVVGADNTVYFVGNKNDNTAWVYVFAIDGATGAIKAESGQLSASNAQVTLSASGGIYLSANGKIMSLSPTMTVLWEKALDRLTDGSFANANRILLGSDGTLYTTTIQNYANAPNYVVALASADGAQKWRFDYTGIGFGSMALGADGTVYVAVNYSSSSGTNDRARVYAIG